MFARRITSRKLGRWLRGRLTTSRLLRLCTSDRERLIWTAYQCLESGRITDAERLYALVATFWPDNSDGPLGLGTCRFRSGDLQGAKLAFETALSRGPNDPFALCNLAEIRLMQGDAEAVTELLERAGTVLERGEQHPLASRLASLRSSVASLASSATRTSPDPG